jgi:hypothetical protein
LRRVRERQALLVELDREALLDVVVWMRRPVRRSASKEVLAKEIARSDRTGFEGLSERGLWALARLRGVEPLEGEPRELLQRRLVASDGLWSRIRRRRRQWVGRMVVRMMSSGPDEPEDYQFLPPCARRSKSKAWSGGSRADSVASPTITSGKNWTKSSVESITS